MTIVEQMINKYKPQTLEEKKNVLKEVIQEIILASLSKTDFFNHAAFYGGTALRIFYGIDRFSEDMDFSLLTSNDKFDITKYFLPLKHTFNALGFEIEINKKDKSSLSNIESAFVKMNTKETFISIYTNLDDLKQIIHNEKLKVKFEVDINPPLYANTEIKYGLLPFPYQIRIYDFASLFAGKIHAVIVRSWKSRIKGRDLYDYLFFLGLNAKVNLRHLEERLKQTKTIANDEFLTKDLLINILNERFDNINYQQAKLDVGQFIMDSSVLELWSSDFFKSVTNNIKC